MANSSERAFTISTTTILKIALILLVLWFVYVIRDVLALLFVSFIMASGITPWVDRLQKLRVPRVVSVLGIYVVLFGIFSLVVVLIVPALVEEIRQLTQKLPDLARSLASVLPSFGGDGQSTALDAIEKNLSTISQNLLQLTSGVFGTLASLFGGFASFITVLVIVFYMTVEEQGTKKFIQSVAPLKFQPYLVHLVNKIQERMGSWLRGQLLLSLIIGTTIYIGLAILGVKYALLLALLAGVFEIIPFIGPILAAIPAVFFAGTESWLLAGLTAALYLIVQQLENTVIVPKVMQQTVGLNPIVILIAVLIGGRIGGFLGVILSVPVAAIIAIFLRDVMEDRRMKENEVATN